MAWKRWQKLSHKDQLRWLFVGTLSILGTYGLLIYPQSHKDMEYSESMVARKLDRIEKRTVISGARTENLGALESEMSKLEKEQERVSTELENLQERFVSGESGEQQQSLLLELSTLASESGLYVYAQGIGTVSDSGELKEPQELFDSRSGRPITRLRAQGTYWQLQNFLAGLEAMDFVISPIGVEIAAEQARQKENEPDTAVPTDLLNISLTLTL